jgi:dihydroflavonol-4-reductase
VAAVLAEYCGCCDVKVLLVGATGQVGFALAHALVAQGHDVTLLVRRGGQLKFPAQARVVTEPVFTEAVFARLLSGTDIAIYGVGLPEQFSFDAEVFERVNLRLLKDFLAAMEQSKLRRLVYISTYEVFAAQHGKIHESHAVASLDGVSPYFRAMTQAYVEAIKFAQRTSTALTTIHPAALYGGLNTSEGFTNVIESLLNWRLWKLPVVLPGRFPLVHADSLAQAITSAMDHTGAFIVNDGMSSLKELSAALRHQANSYPAPEVPAALAYAATAPLEALGRALRIRPILCKVQLDFITSGSEPLADHAAQTLAWAPMRLDEGLSRYLKNRTRLLAMHRS